MPVLVMKATEGFADRLTFLAHCIRYCLKNDTALCVDWSDGVWGGHEFDFHDIFELYGVKTMKKETVVKLMASGKVKVHPPCWTAEKVWNPITPETFEDVYSGNLFPENVDECPKIDADIIVTNGKGIRGWFLTDLLEHVRIRPEVSERMRPLLDGFIRKSLVVHLRGTDRLNPEFNQGAIKTAIQFPVDYPIYVVTDSVKLYNEFKASVPQAKLVNPKGEVLKITTELKRGTHLSPHNVLKKYGCNKKQMVIDLLVDFIAIWAAEVAIGQTESFFFKVARQCSKLNPDFLNNFLGFYIR